MLPNREKVLVISSFFWRVLLESEVNLCAPFMAGVVKVAELRICVQRLGWICEGDVNWICGEADLQICWCFPYISVKIERTINSWPL